MFALICVLIAVSDLATELDSLLVPRYEFRCRECSTTFEVSRPMSASAEPARCPSGHGDTVKLLSVAGLARAGSGAPAPAGGCCGGGCCR